jgi:ribosomal protein S18 acetylase RimI-like enzyme
MIRAATEDDLPALVHLHSMVQELHARNAPASFKVLPDVSACLAFFRKLLAEPANWVVVAEEGRAVVGYLFAQEVKREENWMWPPTHLFALEHIAVASSARRKGIGHALMEAFFAEAKKRGAKRAELVYWTFNEVGARFFQKHGFKPMHLRLAASVS